MSLDTPLGHHALLAVSRPDGDGDGGGVAAEPEVAGILGGACLAGDGLRDVAVVVDDGAGGAAVVDDAPEHLRCGVCHLGGDCTRGVVGVLVDDVAVAVEDLGDGDGVAVDAARGERGVGLGHLHGRRADGAQGDGAVGGDVHRDAHGVGRAHDVLGTHDLGDLDVAGVRGDLGGAGERDVAVVGVGVVLDLPGGRDLKRRVAVEDHVGVHALRDSGDERDHLEARARLPARLGGEVELVALEVAAAHHGLDVSGGGVDRHEGALELVIAQLGELLVHGLLGSALPFGVDSGVDLQATAEDGLLLEVLLEQRLDVVGPVGVRAVALHDRLAEVEVELLGKGGVVLLLGDVTSGEHAIEDDVAPPDGKVGVGGGVIGRRGLREAGEQRCLGEGELGRMLVEVGPGCGLDAIGSMAVVDGVEVHEQDLVLGVDLLELDGDVCLADLPLEALLELLVGQDGVSHQLLGDGRRALVAAGQDGERRARDALDVDAVVLVEADVLGVDGALDDVGGDLLHGDGASVLEVELGDDVAVGVIDLRGLGDEVGVGRGVVWQVLEPELDERAKRERQGEPEQGKKAKSTDDAERNNVGLGVLACPPRANTHATSRFVTLRPVQSTYHYPSRRAGTCRGRGKCAENAQIFARNGIVVA